MVILPSLSLTRKRERHNHGDGDDDKREREVFCGGFLGKRLMRNGFEEGRREFRERDMEEKELLLKNGEMGSKSPI